MIYRKSLKGIDELAFKSGMLSLRQISYLLAVDGVSSLDELSRRHPHLTNIKAVLCGLLDQGLVEVVRSSPATCAPASRPGDPLRDAAGAGSGFPQLDALKGTMARDVGLLLGGGADALLALIRNCGSQGDLKATLPEIKHAIATQLDIHAAERFGRRYELLDP